MKSFFYLIACLMAIGCGSALPRSVLGDPAYRAPAADAYPDDSAVVLLHRETFKQTVQPTEVTHTIHQVVAILRDEGLTDHSAFFVALSDDETLLDFEARVRTSEGIEHMIDREALVERTVESKSRHEDPNKPAVAWELTKLQGIIPGVDVGSVLELRYRIRGEYLASDAIRVPDTNIPIRRFERDVYLPHQVRFDVEVLNSEVPFKISRTAAGTHIQWTLLDLQADRPESHSGLWHQRKPWMLYRAKQVVIGPLRTKTWDLARSWSDIDSSRYKTLYVPGEDEHIFRDLHPAPGTASCGGQRRCIIESVWAHMHATVMLSGIRTQSWIGSLAPVIESGRAHSAQLATWLWYLLRAEGVEAYLASVQPIGAISIGLDRPMHGVFTTLVVYVPPQVGIEQTLWLDPSCTACAVGQLPKWSHHRPARVIKRVTQDAQERVEIEDEIHVTQGQILPRGEERITWIVEPDTVDGRWRWHRISEATGQEAVLTALDWAEYDTQKWRQRARSLVAHRFPRGQISALEPGRCIPRDGRCVWTISGTMAAPDHGGRIVWPLHVFERYRGNDFERSTRQGPIWFPYGREDVERVVLRIPPGYQVTWLPASRHETSVGIDFHLDAWVEGQTVVVDRRLKRRVGLYPKEAYTQLRRAVRRFVSARGEAIILTQTLVREPEDSETGVEP